MDRFLFRREGAFEYICLKPESPCLDSPTHTSIQSSNMCSGRPSPTSASMIWSMRPVVISRKDLTFSLAFSHLMLLFPPAFTCTDTEGYTNKQDGSSPRRTFCCYLEAFWRQRGSGVARRLSPLSLSVIRMEEKVPIHSVLVYMGQYIWDSLNGTLDEIGHGTRDNVY